MMKRLFVLLLFFAATAHAQSMSVYGLAGTTPKTFHGKIEMRSVMIAYDRALSPRTDVSFVLAPVSFDQPVSWFGDQFDERREDIRALGGAILLRRRFYVDARVQPYVEAGTGPMWAERAVPAATSRFNFMSHGGAGVTVGPLLVGYRFLHISNGGYSPRNPGLNVHGLVFGVRWRR